MKKILSWFLLVALIVSVSSAAFAAEQTKQGPAGPVDGPGPAPNSGDGVPDGPGW